MKKNKSFLILLLIISQFLQAQEYDRVWGTYYGPATTIGNADVTAKGLTLENNNIQVNFHVAINSQNPASYYNQYITTGAGIDMSLPYSNFDLTLSSNGTLVKASYESKYFIEKDSSGNHYYLQLIPYVNPVVGTSGTWYPNIPPVPNIPTGQDYPLVFISKKNASGTILWQTYLPVRYITNLEVDELGNIYIAGSTGVTTGITTPGVFQENYEVVPNATEKENGFVAKLNPNGQLIWASYLPFQALVIRHYNNHLYLLGNWDSNPNATTLATPNAFQSQKGILSITKMDTATGNRVWGTYYGNPDNSELAFGFGFKVNQRGIFVIGDAMDMTGTPHSYFGTAGSHQPTSAGDTDIFLSKFNLDGQRLWSTYFGSAGNETCFLSNSPLALSGNSEFITLLQYSEQSTNLATPGSYMDTPPAPYVFSNPNLDVGYNRLMFAKFNDNGNLNWASYYGGSSKNLMYDNYMASISIGVANDNTLYLYGSTRSNTGHTTPGAIQPNNTEENLVGYFARFDKKTEMSTTETDHLKDLVLYNNPNNGAFALQGSVLQKKALQMVIYDSSGRLILQQKLNKDYKQSFDFSHQLKTDNYFLELKDNKQLIKSFKLIVK